MFFHFMENSEFLILKYLKVLTLYYFNVKILLVPIKWKHLTGFLKK